MSVESAGEQEGARKVVTREEGRAPTGEHAFRAHGAAPVCRVARLLPAESRLPFRGAG